MKKLEKLSLHNLAKNEMNKREQLNLMGGNSCKCSCPTASCPCLYAGPQEGSDDSYYGGASIADNEYANTVPEGKVIAAGNF